MTNQLTHQQIYDRLREVGRDEFIREQMVIYGFWPADEPIPSDPSEEIQEIRGLKQELAQLYQKNRSLKSEKDIKKQLLKERLAEAKRKRVETKERRERLRLERADSWKQRKQEEIVFLGEGVSGGLNEFSTDSAKLNELGLPCFMTVLDLANGMGISVGELRFLAFDRRVSRLTHYVNFCIPKKTGGTRLISAPMPRLKRVQRWILEHIINLCGVHEAAHGFCLGRSIVSNALVHVGADVVINLDLKNFFPSISYKRVKGLFRSFGYSEAIATILGLLCTQRDTEAVVLDGVTYYVGEGDRFLPQGSPVSPGITNLLCRGLDARLSQMAGELGFTYTRYADDLTFSGSGDSLANICNVLRRAESIVGYEGFTINSEKTRIMRRKSNRLEVTGVVVNSVPTVAKRELRRFRATLYQIEKDGLAGKSWGNSDDTLAAIQGYASFVAMVNPEKGAVFLEQVERIKKNLTD